jgi:hypothetical protein
MHPAKLYIRVAFWWYEVFPMANLAMLDETIPELGIALVAFAASSLT